MSPRGLAGDSGRGLGRDNVRCRCRGLTGDGGQGLAGESGRCRRQGRSGLARDNGGRISTLFLDTERWSCSRSPSSRDSSLLSMFSTHAAGLHSLSLVCKDQTSQHLASTLPSSVFVGGATGCGVLGASGGLYTLHGLASAPSLVHGGKGVDSAHARLRRPVLPDVGSSMSSLPIFVRRKIPIILYCAKKHRTTIKSALNLPKEIFCDDIRSSRLSQGVNHKKNSIFTQRSLSCCTVAKEPYD